MDIDAQAACDSTGEWQCGVRRLAVANGPNIFQMLLVANKQHDFAVIVRQLGLHTMCNGAIRRPTSAGAAGMVNSHHVDAKQKQASRKGSLYP